MHRIYILAFLILPGCIGSQEPNGPAAKEPARHEMKAIAVPETLPREFSDIRYEVEIVGVDETGRHLSKTEYAPNYAMRFGKGILLGGDRGEWGGELIFRDADNKDHKVLSENVRGIFQGKSEAIVFTGLMHMGFNNGAIYLIATQENGFPATPKLIRQLTKAPSRIEQIGHDSFLISIDEAELTDTGDEEKNISKCYIFKSVGSLLETNC